MPERRLKQPGFTYSACEKKKKNKEKIENLCRLQILFTDMNSIKLVFSMIWLMAYELHK